MSDASSALGGATFQGFVTVREVGPIGMITLRAEAELPGLADTVLAVVGLGLPAPREIAIQGERAVAWMSPDEYLLVLPYADVGRALATLANSLVGVHHLAADVSDARAVFRIEGAKADQVLMKLCPVNFATLQPAEIRRTRAAQVACAIWRDGDGFMLVCFRSVAAYVMGLLTHSAQSASEIA